MAENEISKEEKKNTKNLKDHYEATTKCPYCHIKLPINGQCGNLMCSH